jgi:MinD superfamily P-loop ATPase
MKKITVISGKGGTGKTVLTASFASLSRSRILVDCDVDAADLHLLVHPTLREKHQFTQGSTASIDQDFCTECGRCREVCRFSAIAEDYRVDPVSCEGCWLCCRICPAAAIDMKEDTAGEWYISETAYGTLVHARLAIAGENSGKLVTTIKKAAEEIAREEGCDYMILDGPPGIGCPVSATLSGTDVALVVTEPTLSGIHDMERVFELAAHFNMETAVVINKFDLHRKNTDAISSVCERRGVSIAGRIPFSLTVSESIIRMVPAVEYCEPAVREAIGDAWNRVTRL